MKSPRYFSLAVLGSFAFALAQTSSHAEPDLTLVRQWIEAQSKVATVSGTFNQERKLRTVKRPLTSSGRFAFKIPGSFRWQVGTDASPELIAVRKAGGDFWILRPEKKEAERHTAESLEREGKANAAAFLEAGFPRDFATFQRDYEVEEIRPNANGEIMEIEVSLRDRKAATAVRKIIFYVDSPKHLLRGFKLYFRDTSTIFCSFTRVDPGVSLPDSTFEVNTAGYKVTEGK